MSIDFGLNAGLVEELHARYLENPQSVAASWQRFFEEQSRASKAAPPTRSVTPDPPSTLPGPSVGPPSSISPGPMSLPGGMAIRPKESTLSGRVHQLITAYRFIGHLSAHINPLSPAPKKPRELDPATYGFSDEDLDREFPTIDLAGPDTQTLRDIIAQIDETYCRTIGIEYRAIQSSTERHWLQDRMETSHNRLALDRDAQVHLLTKLSDAEQLEQFIHSSYAPGTKRFSLEGCESLIPLLDVIVERSAAEGAEEIVFGMAHRGRLNVLANTLETSLRQIFNSFEDSDAERYLGRGDVKYHLGFSTDRITSSGKSIHLTMCFNPSHLEFVNPVVEGRVRAKQERAGDRERKRIIPLLIHGDAAFVGQGVVAETLNLTGLDGYTTGGTIHVIVNNQIGFTTDPRDSRSTRYASDIVRMLDVPVFHVNGEDPEAVSQVAHLAVAYRQRFGKDVLIDLYGYRRYGHNEGDEPRFTQPKMYELIDAKATVREVYVEHLIELGQIDRTTADDIAQRSRQRLKDALDEVKTRGFTRAEESMGGVWAGYVGGHDADVPEVDTALAADTLVALSDKLTSLPEDLAPHRKIAALLKQRHERLSQGKPFDWGTAENMAYASLLAEGTPIRISGEDVGRGTFSHRHAVVFDMNTGAPFVPLNHLADEQGHYESCNSPLSEAGVLGFDFGYSLDSPDALVIWEAQFGDFLNAAQVIVDQFITSCEDKWMRLSGLVLYLPHGYEGQGPEHSSARLERFLQNAAEDNIQICNLTTPAQLFHVLRRQILRPYRKPLVILTPKSLLRAAVSAKGPKPTSTLDDLSHGRFQRVIPDDGDPATVERILLCSGKVYYDLAKHRFDNGRKDVAIVRLEQLYPFNDELAAALAGYPDGTPLVWVQEEPYNYGGWFYIQSNVRDVLGSRLPLHYVTRERSASPATGSKASHKLETDILLRQAFDDEPVSGH
jgi:2-oxoglutarate dehydrogenase E1 component